MAQLSGIARRFVGTALADDPVVLSARRDRLVVGFGDIVLKVHVRGTDAAHLAARLAIAADPRLGGVLLAPLPIPGATLAGLAARVGDRYVSAWPAGVGLGPGELDDVPWEQVAAMLAQMHAPSALAAASASAWASAGHLVPPAVVCRRLERAVGRLATLDDPLAEEILQAHATLPAWVRWAPMRARVGRAALVHGDWHLGQLLRVGGAFLRIIDIDDIGVGDPAWDLARPAAWYAAGLLAQQAWERLLGGYSEAGGTAFPPGADPWVTLDGPARALAVQYAATAVADRACYGEPLDEAADAFVKCCRRMVRLRSLDAGHVGRLPTSPEVSVSRSVGSA
jgi:hypothetical protein